MYIKCLYTNQYTTYIRITNYYLLSLQHEKYPKKKKESPITIVMASHLISINKLKQKQVNRFKITLRMLFITIKHLVKLNLTVCLLDLFT